MSFAQEILHWYQQNKRDLPWRGTKDPFVIWMSEVILQQTRVAQGLPYFDRFLDRFPTVESLASASEDEVLLLWEGLGYYSRARNMHAAAKAVLREHKGRFPDNFDALRRLKGVGAYTAAAVSSIAASEPRAAVDGNVYRVLARYFGIDTPINTTQGIRQFQELSDQLLVREDPGTYNQAVMEFGSQQCTPARPACNTCPLRPGCIAYQEDRVNQLPVKLKAKPRRPRYFNYFLIALDDHIFLNKRPPGDIWANLYELPLLETPEPVPPGGEEHLLSAMSAYFEGKLRIKRIAGPIKHILSHQDIYAGFYAIEGISFVHLDKIPWIYVAIEKLNILAKPKLIGSFISQHVDGGKDICQA